MGWMPTRPSDVWWFLVSPLTTVPFGIYSLTGAIQEHRGEENPYPYGEPDWRASARNSAIWTGSAFASWAYHAIVHPGKYAWTSASSAYKILGHTAASSAVVLPAVAVAAAAGYGATHAVHGGAPVLPESMTFGGVGPGHYADSTDPMVDFERAVDGVFDTLMFWD